MGIPIDETSGYYFHADSDHFKPNDEWREMMTLQKAELYLLMHHYATMVRTCT